MNDKATRELEVFAVSDGSYEWADFHVFRHPRAHGFYAIDFDAGCSCMYYSYPTVDALHAYQPLSGVEVRHHFQIFLGNHGYAFGSASSCLGLVEELNTKLAEEAGYGTH